MALEDILSRIEHEAETRKSLILADARDEAESRLNRAKQKIEKEAEEFLHKKKREAELVVQRELAEAHLQGRNQIGRVKAEALQRIRETMQVSLLATIDSSLEVWSLNILLNNSSSRDEEVLMAPPEMSRLGKKFLDQINHDHGTAFSFAGETKTISRGFILKKKGMMINLSFQSLSDDIFRMHEREVTKILFQENNE